MTHDRPYRGALPVADALAEIERCRGTQFDPLVGDAFLGLARQEAGPGLTTYGTLVAALG